MKGDSLSLIKEGGGISDSLTLCLLYLPPQSIQLIYINYSLLDIIYSHHPFFCAENGRGDRMIRLFLSHSQRIAARQFSHLPPHGRRHFLSVILTFFVMLLVLPALWHPVSSGLNVFSGMLLPLRGMSCAARQGRPRPRTDRVLLRQAVTCQDRGKLCPLPPWPVRRPEKQRRRFFIPVSTGDDRSFRRPLFI